MNEENVSDRATEHSLGGFLAIRDIGLSEADVIIAYTLLLGY